MEVNTRQPAVKSLLTLLKQLWKHVSPRRRAQVGLVFFLMILASFAEVVSIGAILPFLGALTAPEWIFNHPIASILWAKLGLTEPGQLLLPLTVGFSLAVLLSGMLRLVLYWAQARLSHAIGADFSISIYRRTLYQPYSVHVARNSSEVIAGIAGKADKVVYETLLPCLIILSSCMMLCVIMIVLVSIEPTVALGSFAGFGLIYTLVVLFTRKRLAIHAKSISREHTRIIKVLQEALGGIRDVLIDGTQSTYCKIFRDADLALRRAQASVVIMGGTPRFAIEALGMVLIAVIAYFLSGRPAGLQSAIPVLGALALGAQRMLPVLQQAYASWISMRGGQETLVDTLGLLEQTMPESAVYEGTRPEPIPFLHQIELRGVSFRYSGSGAWVLRDVGISIPKGSRVGLIGSTGSGKSTMLDIFMGLLTPTEGSMLIDEEVIDLFNQRLWQSHIAHVPQSIFLADTTVAENIAFGIPVEQIDINRVHEAARKAQIADVIETLPEGYDTFVGERGVRLSGGQRQRIGIARALYKEADVIIFDEATSALDTSTERTVMEAIESLGDDLTILIAAHRLTTLKGCTLVLELSEGAIKRWGTYDEIVQSNV